MDFHGEKPAVAIVGGFQIGKSTLVNCLLDDRYAPTGKGLRTTTAATLFRYGEAEEAWLFRGDNPNGERLASRKDIFDPSREIGPDDWFCVSAWKPILQHVDVVDTPGYDAQNADDKSASAAIAASSVVVIVQAAKTMDDVCRAIVREACVPGKRCLFLLNCTNPECWAPADTQNAEIVSSIEAELASMGVADYFLRIGAHLVHPINALWAWYATGQSARDMESPNEAVRKDAERANHKIRRYAQDELLIEVPSPSAIMERSGFPELRRKLAELGKKDGMEAWLDEAKRRAGAIYDMAAPVVADAAVTAAKTWNETIVPNAKTAAAKARCAINTAALATATVFHDTIAPNTIKATVNAKAALGRFLASFGKHRIK